MDNAMSMQLQLKLPHSSKPVDESMLVVNIKNEDPWIYKLKIKRSAIENFGNELYIMADLEVIKHYRQGDVNEGSKS